MRRTEPGARSWQMQTSAVSTTEVGRGHGEQHLLANRSPRAPCVSTAALSLLPPMAPTPWFLPAHRSPSPDCSLGLGKAPQWLLWHSYRITPVVAPLVTHCPLCEHMLVNTYSSDLWVIRLWSEPFWGSPRPPHVLAAGGQTRVCTVTQHCQNSHGRRGPSVLPAPFCTGVTVQPLAMVQGRESVHPASAEPNTRRQEQRRRKTDSAHKQCCPGEWDAGGDTGYRAKSQDTGGPGLRVVLGAVRDLAKVTNHLSGFEDSSEVCL